MECDKQTRPFCVPPHVLTRTYVIFTLQRINGVELAVIRAV